MTVVFFNFPRKETEKDIEIDEFIRNSKLNEFFSTNKVRLMSSTLKFKVTKREHRYNFLRE